MCTETYRNHTGLKDDDRVCVREIEIYLPLVTPASRKAGPRGISFPFHGFSLKHMDVRVDYETLHLLYICMLLYICLVLF